MGDKLIDLLRESVLVQATITLVCVSGLVYLYVTGKPVSDGLVNIVMVIVGYYFGSKTQNIINRAKAR